MISQQYKIKYQVRELFKGISGGFVEQIRKQGSHESFLYLQYNVEGGGWLHVRMQSKEKTS